MNLHPLTRPVCGILWKLSGSTNILRLPDSTSLLLLAATSALIAPSLTRAAVPSGPAIGAKVPAFEALDQNGQKQTLATLRGPKGLVLVFFRSADW